MNNYDDTTFQEVKAIVERRFARRMKFVRGLLIGSFLAILTITLCFVFSDYAFLNYRNQVLTWNELSQYYQLFLVIGMGTVAGYFYWVWSTVSEMWRENNQDRVLRHEIEGARKWRLRQWEQDNADQALSYSLTEDSEIEETLNQTDGKYHEQQR